MLNYKHMYLIPIHLSFVAVTRLFDLSVVTTVDVNEKQLLIQTC